MTETQREHDLRATTRLRRSRHLLVALALGATVGCLGDAPRPSVVVVSLDTTRADHWGVYGYPRDVTPRLDRLASTGLVFDNAVTSSGNTLISHASLFTGLFPGAHGVSPVGRGGPLHPSYDTMAEEFRAAGFDTAAFVAHGDWLTPDWGLDQGFARFDSAYRDADAVLAHVRAWLDDRPVGAPFFLFVHLFDVHSDWTARPYDAPVPFRGRFTASYAGPFHWPSDEWPSGSNFLFEVNRGEIALGPDDVQHLIDQYDEGLAYVDDRIGHFIAELRERWPDTWVVVTADHGEAFMEHGTLLHGEVYPEVMRVPLVLLPPADRADEVGAPRRLREQVQLVDVRPTLLSLAGLPEPRVRQGVDLMPWLRGESSAYHPPSAPLFYHPTQRYEGVRHEGYTLIRRADREDELFAHGGAGARENLIARPDLGDRVTRLERRLDAHRVLDETVRRLHGAGTGGPALRPEALERLRRLGYLR